MRRQRQAVEDLLHGDGRWLAHDDLHRDPCAALDCANDGARIGLSASRHGAVGIGVRRNEARPGANGIKRDLERGCFGAVPLELASRTAHDNEPSEAFYDTLLHGLKGLETWSGSARFHCAWQLARLLAAAGFAPELARCVHCGGEIGHNPGFDIDSGGVCGQCPSDRRYGPEEFAALVALFDAVDRCPPVAHEATVFRMVRAYMIRQTETDYRSLRVLHDMFGS